LGKIWDFEVGKQNIGKKHNDTVSIEAGQNQDAPQSREQLNTAEIHRQEYG